MCIWLLQRRTPGRQPDRAGSPGGTLQWQDWRDAQRDLKPLRAQGFCPWQGHPPAQGLTGQWWHKPLSAPEQKREVGSCSRSPEQGSWGEHPSAQRCRARPPGKAQPSTAHRLGPPPSHLTFRAFFSLRLCFALLTGSSSISAAAASCKERKGEGRVTMSGQPMQGSRSGTAGRRDVAGVCRLPYLCLLRRGLCGVLLFELWYGFITVRLCSGPYRSKHASPFPAQLGPGDTAGSKNHAASVQPSLLTQLPASVVKQYLVEGALPAASTPAAAPGTRAPSQQPHHGGSSRQHRGEPAPGAGPGWAPCCPVPEHCRCHEARSATPSPWDTAQAGAAPSAWGTALASVAAQLESAARADGDPLASLQPAPAAAKPGCRSSGTAQKRDPIHRVLGAAAPFRAFTAGDDPPSPGTPGRDRRLWTLRLACARSWELLEPGRLRGLPAPAPLLQCCN